MAKYQDLKVCSPVPWFPVLAKGEKYKGNENWKGLEVYRPRFFYTPMILKNQDARFYAKGIQSWLKDFSQVWRPDMLDAHFIWPDGVGVYLLARRLGIPYVVTLRGKIYECIKVSSQKEQCADALKHAAAIISVSGLMAQEAVRMGAVKERVHVIPNGVDFEHFFIKDKKACRQLLELPLDKRILVTVAHLGHRKGHYEVIKALAGLPEDIVLVLVGGAAQGGTPEMIREAAQKSGVAERLILKGPQDYSRIPLYFSAADASVLASYREGCPNAVLESLACGTPVVATDVGAVRDILPVPEAGRIVPARQVEPLVDALGKVLDQEWDPESVLRASQVKSWDQVALDVHQVFELILKDNRNR